MTTISNKDFLSIRRSIHSQLLEMYKPNKSIFDMTLNKIRTAILEFHPENESEKYFELPHAKEWRIIQMTKRAVESFNTIRESVNEDIDRLKNILTNLDIMEGEMKDGLGKTKRN